MLSIHQQIAKGSDVFLFTEYVYLLIFVFILAILIFFFGEIKKWTLYTTVSFILGALTSMLCGFIGMKIAVNSNWRTTFAALYFIYLIKFLLIIYLFKFFIYNLFLDET
jgi:H+-translocating diphosphatase